MIEILLYLVKSILAGAIFFGFYLLFMRKESYLLLNRYYLLVSALLMLLLPLLGNFLAPSHFRIGKQAPLPIITLPEIVITAHRVVTPEQEKVLVNWALIGYLVITAAMLLGLIYSIFRIIRFYKSAMKAERLKDNIYLVPENGSPFSFMGRIFISSRYADHPGLGSILIHENAHIHQKHILDLILLELLSSIFWFNPFFFLIKKAIREVHEYLADREVIRKGAEPLTYQQLLFNEVSGNPQYIIANNFNLLTKKRIVMLLKKSGKSAAIRIGIMMPVLLTTAFIIGVVQTNNLNAQISEPPSSVATVQEPTPPAPPATPGEALIPEPPAPAAAPAVPQKADPPAKKSTPAAKTTYPVKQKSEVKYTKPVVKEDDGKTVYKVVDKMPEYPGGPDAMSKYMVGAIKYPKTAVEKGIMGTVYITFVVEKDGAISNVKVLRGVGGGCDEEALRVVGEMPNWIPGKNKGKAVRVQFNLPVKFALS
ncbi:MAG: M56 family metallopeptidase [Bacteroidetes bacterium]|nr:M56 family metallopeptidase [Bacteroidota bacterium]